MLTRSSLHFAPVIRVTLGMASGVALGSCLTLFMAVM